jgi:4-amino-4-deoxy-L-arabinose transferase-like glycosyltransferase
MQSNSNTDPYVKPMSLRRIAIAIFAFALLLYLLGNGEHSLWDRDEARFSEATREMIETGDWIIPHLNGEIRYDKPILIYWLMSVPMRLWGVNEFSARFPSAMAGALTVLLVFGMALRMGFGLSGARVAAAATMLNVLLFAISKAATTDATLTFTVTAAMFLYWEQRRAGFAWWRHLAFWAVLGLSALVKGPPGVAVVALAILCDKAWTLWTWRRRNNPPPSSSHSALSTQHSALSVQHSALLRICLGLVVFLLVALPWGWAAWQRTNGDFFRVALGHHVIDRSTQAFEGHKGPFFYYVALLPLLVFPMTAVLLNAVRWAVGADARRDPTVRLLWCWVVPGLVVFSLVKTKLPHYVAPLLPALALMMGAWWSEWDQKDIRDPRDGVPGERPTRGNVGRAWWTIGGVLMALAGIAVLAGDIIAMKRLTVGWSKAYPSLRDLSAPLHAWGLLLSVTLFAGGCLWLRRRATRAVAVWLAGIVLVYVILTTAILPRLEPLRPSKQIGLFLRENAPPNTELMAAGYKEPSLMFYAQRGMREVSGKEAEEAIARLQDLDHPASLVITDGRWREWLKAHREPLPARVSVRLKGRFFDFQKGKPRDLVVVGNW